MKGENVKARQYSLDASDRVCVRSVEDCMKSCEQIFLLL